MLILIYALLRILLPQGIIVFTVYCHNSKLKLMAQRYCLFLRPPKKGLDAYLLVSIFMRNSKELLQLIEG